MQGDRRAEPDAAAPNGESVAWEVRLREELVDAARRLTLREPRPAPAPGGDLAP